MNFYTAVGSCELKRENGRLMPYILRMGCREPVSIPEFLIWSRLLWEVETYRAVRESYTRQAEQAGVRLPDFDRGLDMLVKRRLVAAGTGYTGEDALYDLLSGMFVLPVRDLRGKRLRSAVRLLARGTVGLREAVRCLKPVKMEDDERRVMALVRKTPLSVSELIRGFDNGVRKAGTAEQVIEAIYTDFGDTREQIRIQSGLSSNRTAVLQAVADLYLRPRVVLDMA